MSNGNKAEQEKEIAAKAASELVEDGMLVGLGTGSTVAYLIPYLGTRVAGGLKIKAVSTSQQTADQAAKHGITVIPFDGTKPIDLTIDGADEIDPELRLIKGGGGALLHEKLVAVASARNVVIADSAKLVKVLGARALPVEVIKFGWHHTAAQLEKLGSQPKLREDRDGKPFISQEGNYILDCQFNYLPQVEKTAESIKALVGVIEHGLFLKTASEVIVGRDGKTELMKR